MVFVKRNKNKRIVEKNTVWENSLNRWMKKVIAYVITIKIPYCFIKNQIAYVTQIPSRQNMEQTLIKSSN